MESGFPLGCTGVLFLEDEDGDDGRQACDDVDSAVQRLQNGLYTLIDETDGADLDADKFLVVTLGHVAPV